MWLFPLIAAFHSLINRLDSIRITEQLGEELISISLRLIGSPYLPKADKGMRKQRIRHKEHRSKDGAASPLLLLVLIITSARSGEAMQPHSQASKSRIA
jgi:hypothetical protein